MKPAAHRRRAVFAWALYDFANSAFTTLVVTFIYAAYFTRGIVGDDTRGAALWSWAVAGSALAVAVLSPFAGALADQAGARKRFLAAATVLTILGTVALYFPQRGQILLALAVFFLTNTAYELANVFYNAFLPDIAPRERIGRVSGFGWALGYAGGLLCMVLALFCLIRPAQPWFGLSGENGQNVRAANLLTAAWYAVFSLPLFLWTPAPRVSRKLSWTRLGAAALGQLTATFREIRGGYRQIFRLLAARLFYNEGLITLFAFGGIYAQGVFGFTTSEILVFGIALNVAAGIGAWAFGVMDDRWGGKKTILLSLLGLIGAGAAAVLARSRLVFWAAAIMVGLLVGPAQSASRSLLGRFVPPDRENEFFGFFAFSGKAVAFFGPLVLGRLTAWFDSQRAGMASVLLFFILGALLLLRVDEAEGLRAAGSAPDPERSVG
ncbi:MAG: MFS transporter [Verrucomicrobia bacterium]|nr:MFS transporter [Verrucomicrobiota bacterium]